jgi:hypothetical protein
MESQDLIKDLRSSGKFLTLTSHTRFSSPLPTVSRLITTSQTDEKLRRKKHTFFLFKEGVVFAQVRELKNDE